MLTASGSATPTQTRSAICCHAPIEAVPSGLLSLTGIDWHSPTVSAKLRGE
jgi:hypothetical protein